MGISHTDYLRDKKPFSSPLSIDIAKSHYHLYHYAKVPAASNLLMNPLDSIDAAKHLRKSIEQKDRETVLNTAVHLVEAPLDYYSSVGVFLSSLASIKILPIRLDLYIHGWMFLAAFLSYVQTGLELIGIKKELDFAEKLKLKLFKEANDLSDGDLEKLLKEVHDTAVENLQKELSEEAKPLSIYASLVIKELQEKLLQKKLSEIHRTYFQISAEEADAVVQKVNAQYSDESTEEKKKIVKKRLSVIMEGKHHHLLHRVRPWMAEKLYVRIPHLLSQMKSAESVERTRAAEEALVIIGELDQEIKYKLAIHIFGALAFSITAIGLTIGAAFTLPIISTILITLGTVLMLGRFFYGTGSIGEKGWNFNWKKGFYIDKIENLARKLLPLKPAEPEEPQPREYDFKQLKALWRHGLNP